MHVRTMSANDEAAAIDTIALAFAADPVSRWFWPHAHQFLTAMPPFIHAFAGTAFAQESAFCTSDHAGVALWLPPGAHPDSDRMDEIMASTASAVARADGPAIFEQMAKFHPPEPHWYLPFIAVDPAWHGKGHGDALMTYSLARCDRDKLPAYLESTNPRNITLYQRHGFEALSKIQVGSSPPLVPMLRHAR